MVAKHMPFIYRQGIVSMHGPNKKRLLKRDHTEFMVLAIEESLCYSPCHPERSQAESKDLGLA
jgi:hypothetical protein